MLRSTYKTADTYFKKKRYYQYVFSAADGNIVSRLRR